jgi:hypothetical protein
MNSKIEFGSAFRAVLVALLVVVSVCACSKKEALPVVHEPVSVLAVVTDKASEPTAPAPKPITEASGAPHPEPISLDEQHRVAMQHAVEAQQSALHTTKTASKKHAAPHPADVAAGAPFAPAPAPLLPPTPPASNQVPGTAGVAYDVPNEMMQAVATTVNLWIDPHKNSDQVQQALRDYLTSADMQAKGSKARKTSQAQKDAAAVQGTTLQLVHTYKATLKSADGNFNIALLGSDQITPNLDSQDPMAWVWEVTPLKPAEAMDLVLSVTEVVQNGASQSERPFRPPMLVHVKVRSSASWMQQAIDFLVQFKALIAALTGVVAAAGALWLGLKKFGSKEPKT